MLNQAHAMIREEKPEEAKKHLTDAVTRYGHTPEATEANKMLTTLKVDDDIASEHLTQTRKHTLLTALVAFRLDTGRWPTQSEGLGVLLDGKGIKRWNGPYIPPGSTDFICKFEYVPKADEEPELRPKPD